VGGLGDIARDQHASAPRRLDLASGLAGIFVLLFVQVADQDVRTLAGVGDRHGATDAAVASGDHRHPPDELFAAPVTRLAVVGLWRHLGFGAGRLDLLLVGLAHGVLLLA
jgi:hypothetical protein